MLFLCFLLIYPLYFFTTLSTCVRPIPFIGLHFVVRNLPFALFTYPLVLFSILIINLLFSETIFKSINLYLLIRSHASMELSNRFPKIIHISTLDIFISEVIFKSKFIFIA